MFPIYLYEGGEIPEDDICYLIGKQGIYLKKKVGLVESLTKVDKISILDEVKPWAKIDLPKIPGPHVAKIISFFKAVVEKFSGEANVLLYYNEQEKKYKLSIPKQQVTAAACDYETEGTTILGYNLVGTIHSHARMSAFHSGTDDADEKNFDGLHITIGHLTDDHPSISASIVVNGFRVIVDPCDYIDRCVTVKIPQKTYVSPYVPTKVYRYINGKMVLDKPETATKPVVKYDERYNIQVHESQKQFNKKWLKKVSRKVWASSTYTRNQNYIDHEFFDFFGSGYDSLTEWMVNKGKEGNTKNILNVGPIKDGVKFPEHEDLEDYNPCQNCVFKDSHLEYAYDILQTGEDPGEDLPETNNYEPEEEFMAKDDGSAAYDPEEKFEQTPEDLVEEQLRSEAYLHEHENQVLIPPPNGNPTTPFSKVKKFLKRTVSR